MHSQPPSPAPVLRSDLLRVCPGSSLGRLEPHLDLKHPSSATVSARMQGAIANTHRGRRDKATRQTPPPARTAQPDMMRASNAICSHGRHTLFEDQRRQANARMQRQAEQRTWLKTGCWSANEL
eukprot:682510-Rhodomonas_salina.2